MLFKHLIKLAFFASIFILLAGCSKRSTYSYYIKHPGELHQMILKCDHKQTEECQDARVVAEALNEYSSLQERFRKTLMQDRSKLMAMQSAQTSSQALQSSSTFEQFADIETGVQERFGQKIMRAEIHLVALKAAYKQARSGARFELENQIKHQKALIEAMLEIVNVNEGE